LKKSDVFALLHNENFKVTYRFDESYNLIKPIGLSLTLFAFYLMAIFYSRISLSFASDSKKTKLA